MAVLNLPLRARAAGFLIAVAVGAPTVPAQELPRTPVLEYQVKAAYLYNFAKFVEWPADKLGDDAGPILVGVFGKDPFGSLLDSTLKEKTVRGHRLEVRRVSGPVELKQCHIVFISEPERRRLAEILESLGKANVLTVSEKRQFADDGGMINFVTEENKVHLEINLHAAERAGIRISSQLLKLARVVRYD
ncbi:MAG: YfiR family protein [Acidobacteria bacterium]|nr:YfiR family protein [Acidobacteriota bacterium]